MGVTSERGGESFLRKSGASPWEREAEEVVTRRRAQKGEETKGGVEKVTDCCI